MIRKKLFRFVCCLVLCCIVLDGISSIQYPRASVRLTASQLSPFILRLRVLADSNSYKAQTLKLSVRDIILNTLADQAHKVSHDKFTDYVTHQLPLLEKSINARLAAEGVPYQARLSQTVTYFPEKKYGNLTFPSGDYPALLVTLGKGRGQNWWCVLYPPLCFTDSIQAYVPDSSQELLKSALSQEAYEALFESGNHVIIRSRILDFIQSF